MHTLAHSDIAREQVQLRLLQADAQKTASKGTNAPLAHTAWAADMVATALRRFDALAGVLL